MTRHPLANPAAIRAALRRAGRNLVPPPERSPSEWAEANVEIALGNAIPGPIRFENAPYQRGMIDAVLEPGVERVSLMAGAQTGKTTVLQCIQAYFVAHAPRSQMVMFPSQGDLQTWLEAKFRPMIDANPSLSGLLAKPRGREGVNNSRMISYPGGFMMFAWAGSPKTMRGRSAPVISVDEIDGMAVTEEGDPVQLLWQRAATFGDQRLLLESSTPTIKGASRIEKAFDLGDGRRYWIACPECKTHQVLRWQHVTWDGKDDDKAEQLPETARYGCPHCGAALDDGQRIAAIRNAEREGGGWRAERPFRGHASFHISELYSTFRRLRDIVRSYLDKLAVGDEQSFVNVSLAETYAEDGEQADPAALQARAAPFPAQVPARVLVLTAGIDMQQDRLEVEVVGWAEGDESWSVDYHVIWGDPLQDETWEELDDYLARPFEREGGGTLKVAMACLDTGGTGGSTQAAYQYLRARPNRKIHGIKGVPGFGKPMVSAPKEARSGKNPKKVKLFLVAVDEAKTTVMRRLNLTKPGPGYCHFPDDRTPEYFDQLCAERLVRRLHRGFTVREWHKTRERNEAFDCRVYATAALKILRPSYRALAEKLRAAEAARAAVKKAPPEKLHVAAPVPEPEHRKVKRSSALGGGRKKSWATTW